MRRLTALALVAVVAALWSGCPEGGGGDDAGPDGGPLQDAGQDGGGPDAGVDGGGLDAGSDAGTGSDAGQDGGTDAGTVTASITAANQTLSTLSTVTTVASVTAAEAGWVAISVPGAGGPEIAGAAAVAAGTTTGVSVAADRPLQDQWQVTFTLYRDLGTLGVFEPAVDTVVMDGSNPVAATVTVTVPATTPAVRYTFLNFGFTAWIVTATPSIFQSTISSSGNNPTVTLRSGWRYEAVANGGNVHPFELITLGATRLDDVVLLSEGNGVTGSLEGDSTVGWTETGAGGTSRFTVSASLASALSGYRCQFHAGMRAGIAVQ